MASSVLETSVLKIFHGARATEAGVLADLDALLDFGVEDLGVCVSLAEPVRVIVPSRSLREHLARRFLQHRGRPVLGLSFQTLQGLALEILQRAGEEPPQGKELFPLLVERFAKEEPELRRQLDNLVDGYLPVAGTVRDLVDAGLEEGLAAVAEEALDSGDGRGSSAAEDRAKALLRVGDAVVRAMAVMGVGRPSVALDRARDLLEADPSAALPARAILVHGFADATGKVADFLEALARFKGARFYLDHPPLPHNNVDIESEGDLEVESSFPRRLQERLESAGAAVEMGTNGPSEPADRRVFSLFETPDPEAEVRSAAGWVRRHLQAGTVPEDLAVVARDLGTYETEIWRCFRRLGIPFSFWGDQGSATEAGREAEGVLDLLRLGERAPVDRWLQVLSWPTGEPATRRVELRLALHGLGVGRLKEVMALNLEPIRRRGGVALPNLQVSSEDELGDEEPSGRPRRRVLAVEVLEEAVECARVLLELLEDWPESASLDEHLARFAALLLNGLRWTGDPPEEALVADLEAVRQQMQAFGPLEISRSELHRLLAGILKGAGRRSLGGRGGGVQVLSVTEARGRTFGHLLVLGMNRGQMPRLVREDPLLPDVLRRRLSAVLPDIPLKSRGFDEERYLFAQLASAAGTVTLARHTSDHDGRPVPPSPLLARLQAEASGKVATASAADLEVLSPLPADEHAQAVGLAGNRSQALGALDVVAMEARREADLGSSEGQSLSRAWSRALGAVLDELDPDLRTAEGRRRRSSLGPFLGLVGSVGLGAGAGMIAGTGASDPRAGRVWVTHLEGIAACPWQTFLRRLLRLEPSPDPLQALPDLSPLLLGQVVHGTMERIIVDRLGPQRRGLAQLQGRSPELVPWPDPRTFENLLSQEVEKTLAEEGMGLSLLAEPLKEQARGLLAQLRELLWAPQGDRLATFGAEIVGEVVVPGAVERSVAFRADLAVVAGGGLSLVDVKTGRAPISNAKGEETRRKHLLQAIRSGGKLQGAAYALAQGATVGEYLFVHPDLRGEYRAFPVSEADGAAAAAFSAAAGTTLDAWEAGTFFPRLVDSQGQKEPDRCGSCEVAEACLRGDSGIRGRLLEVSETLAARSEAEEHLEQTESTFLELWRLPEAQPGAQPGEEGSS